jgi:hypothetical protein
MIPCGLPTAIDSNTVSWPDDIYQSLSTPVSHLAGPNIVHNGETAPCLCAHDDVVQNPFSNLKVKAVFGSLLYAGGQRP